jgi:Lrp/AsnC family transcriptional regulator, leucine-responsive regulatory protein
MLNPPYRHATIGYGGMMADRVEHIDREIIRLLQADARISNQAIADKLRVSPGTITKHIQKLTNQGVLRGYTAIIQPAVLGFRTVGFALIRCSKQSPRHVEGLVSRLKASPGVAEIYKILGDDDLLVKLYAKDNDHYQKIIETLAFDENDKDGNGNHIRTLLVTQIPYDDGLAAVVSKDDRTRGRTEKKGGDAVQSPPKLPESESEAGPSD